MGAYLSTRRRYGQTSGRRAPRVASPSDPFWDLVATSRQLQAPGGCAWDRAQTVQSLLPYLLEETWEVFETVRARRWAELRDELGDVFYTALFLAMTAQRERRLTLRALLRATRRKMVRRHPHVFGKDSAGDPAEAYRHWQRIKRQERTRRAPPRAGAGRAETPKALRELLVAWWDWLRTHPADHIRLRRLLTRWKRDEGRRGR